MNITSPRQLINSLPTICGDISAKSLVVIVLDNGQVESTLHIPNWLNDLDLSQIQEFLRGMDGRSSRALVAVTCEIDTQSAELALGKVQELAQAHECHVLDLLHLFDGRWRSILCQDEDCCPKTGHAMNTDSEVSEEPVLETRWIPANENLRLFARSLCDEEQKLRDQAFADLPSCPTGTPEDLMGWRDNAVTEVMKLLANPDRYEWMQIAKLSSALSDIRTRDGVLRRILDQADQRESVALGLVQLFSVTPARYRAAVSTVLAGAIWLDGNQEMTRYAIDIALEEDPEYSLARLLDTALVHGVPHRVWVDSLNAVGYEKCLAGAA